MTHFIIQILFGREKARRYALLKAEPRIWNALMSGMLTTEDMAPFHDFMHQRIDRIELFGCMVDATAPTATSPRSAARQR